MGQNREPRSEWSHSFTTREFFNDKLCSFNFWFLLHMSDFCSKEGPEVNIIDTEHL